VDRGSCEAVAWFVGNQEISIHWRCESARSVEGSDLATLAVSPIPQPHCWSKGRS